MSGRRAAVVAAGVVLGAIGYRLLRDDLHQSVIRSLPTVLTAWTAIAAGLVARSQRPRNPIGLLMIAFGFAVLVRTWQYSTAPGVFTLGFLLGQVNLALFAHVVLAYPSGRVIDRHERRLVWVAYAAVVLFPLASLLVHEPGAALKYVPFAPDSPLALAGDAELARALERAFVLLVYGVLAAWFVVLLVRKLVRATPRARHILAPLLLAALIAASRALSESLFTFASPPPAIVDRLYWWQVAGQIALPLMLLGGLLASRLAAAHVADLVRELDRVPPREVQAALARTVGDPTLEVAFWLPERSAYADEAGAIVDPTRDGGGRAVTRIDHDGDRIAALVHDPGLLDDPELLEAAAAAARLALENARLHAETRAQLVQVKESRARIVAAGDEERRRIERDIHDGAQQRLVALALELRAAQRRHDGALAEEVDTLLAGAVDQLQLAVAELRELARGVHPAVLTEDGLAAALESLAARTPLNVHVDASCDRVAPELEAAAYFVACEALANTVKHADASAVRITAASDDRTLVVEVADDGVGGADAGRGSGLRGLADRVEAHGGSLRVESHPGTGTTVRAELPCAS